MSDSEERDERAKETLRVYSRRLNQAKVMKANGSSNSEIADTLGISESSVRELLKSGNLEIEGPYSFKGADGVKTPIYIFKLGGEKKIIGEATVKVAGGMTFDIQLEDNYKDIETGSFEVPMRYTFFNRPAKPKINWGFNCLTEGVHHGRPEKIWKLSLLQTTHMFTPMQLQQLVVDRIYNDAMEIVRHSDQMTQEWADKTKEIAAPLVLPIYQRKVDEITTYYRTVGAKRDFDDVIERNKENKLNPFYEPLHGHDTLNMLCRIVGTNAENKARVK